MTPDIIRGMRVTFNKDGATLTGTVFHTTVDIQNSRKMAVIEIDDELPGLIETVPMDQVKPVRRLRRIIAIPVVV